MPYNDEEKKIATNLNINVLVLAVGSPLGQSIVKALQNSTLQLTIHGSDIDKMAAGLYFDKLKTTIFPKVSDNNYFKVFTNYVLTNKINVIFPVLAIDHEFFAKYSDFFREHNILIATCGSKIYSLFNDKFLSLNFLRNKNINVPETYILSSSDELKKLTANLDFPVFVKPRFGVSSQHNFIIKNSHSLYSLINAFPIDYFIIQQFLNDQNDYTAGVFLSSDRTFIDSLVIQRELKFGLSYRGTVITDQNIINFCKKTAKIVDANYSINIQFKIYKDEPYIYEINPRLSSTTSVRAKFGFNEPDLTIRDMYNLLHEHKYVKQTGIFSRYWEEIYLFDI